MADCCRYLTIFEWRLFFSRLRNRQQIEGERDSVRTQSPLMQINVDTVCMVRTQFEHLTLAPLRPRPLGLLARNLAHLLYWS
jgi:hypothetical protein